MIRLWVMLDDEPPTTSVDIGRAVVFTCRWSPIAAPSTIPNGYGSRLPNASIVEREGVPRVVSGASRDFEAYPDFDMGLGLPSDEWVQRPGIACEDKYLEPFLRQRPPEFSGVVEAVRYLWSPNWPKGVVEQETEDSANPEPSRLYSVGKLVHVIVE